MNFLKKPFDFIGRHPWWTLGILFLLFLLPTLSLIVVGFIDVLRTWAVKLLGDAGARLADWIEQLLTESLWIVGLVLLFIPPLWPLAALLTAWSLVDDLTEKGSARADFTLTNERAAAAGRVGDPDFFE